MKTIPISKSFTLIEPGPVILVTTSDGEKNNIMTISWTMVMDFSPRFAITTGPWNFPIRRFGTPKNASLPFLPWT
jgi:hypothetical protein